ncbi:MAG: fumarylacetoacetate hydrolase family protein [Microbacteriaceae bacterium]|jgi:2-keto-4-pentenoate hydratase/2-oxohepta-3-ene-1,7-dioic acid hydratase in catechol pathway|nr:fumarylacetoacetate hydrolase family protein [Microbacteriaceae bacterium]HOA86488.1 fumarylacetoacetate hydrolase family protein [Microbacteriaceae bacterium]HPZ33903.1 fumarylacetoacetate hydrolase family protein [Microbacteriaceae bacterium]HQC92736.1 fumarylacetoacetate hydrolase family protein [Microbacteriaceae bacterium]
MRFAHLLADDNPTPRLAVIEPAGVAASPEVGAETAEWQALFLDELMDAAPADAQALIERGKAGLDEVRAALAGVAADDPRRHRTGDYRYASAIVRPPAIVAIGLNYAAHSSELGLQTDSTPTVFTLWPNSLAGHEGTTVWPRSISETVDYEAELGVVIGSAARNVTPADALDHVWGYTVVNDITARDIQFSEAQWSRCKSFDGFTPTGPILVTADEIPDPQVLHIGTVCDGQVVQDASTSQMVHTVRSLIAHLSQSTTLLPGTLISTGSPGGAGYSREPQIFLRDRSTVTVTIEGIGSLTTHCRVID